MITILYEDETLIVVDKPAGMPTMAAPRTDRPSLEAAIAAERPELGCIPEHGIAHRLDNGTSGIVCIGKSVKAYNALRERFSTGAIVKRYSALVLGMPPAAGSIDAAIAHHPRKKTKMIVCESDVRALRLKARPAQTDFAAVCVYRYRAVDHVATYTLLDVAIRTGVRHQIRAHLAWRGHPIAGDRPYQNAGARRKDRLPLERHFLHARAVECAHPNDGRTVIIESPLPEDLASALALMRTAPKTVRPG